MNSQVFFKPLILSIENIVFYFFRPTCTIVLFAVVLSKVLKVLHSKDYSLDSSALDLVINFHFYFSLECEQNITDGSITCLNCSEGYEGPLCDR